MFKVLQEVLQSHPFLMSQILQISKRKVAYVTESSGLNVSFEKQIN